MLESSISTIFRRSKSATNSNNVASAVNLPAESRRILEDVLAELSPRSRLIVVRLREGKSYSDIGAELGISKQAVHKVGYAALQSLREKLEGRGFSGIDSKGFLKSARRDKGPAVN